MAASKGFNLYIKKQIFTVFLSLILMALSYYFYTITLDNSIEKFEAKLKTYKSTYQTMNTEVKDVEKNFKYLLSQLEVLKKYHFRYLCDSNIQSKSYNNYFLVG